MDVNIELHSQISRNIHKYICTGGLLAFLLVSFFTIIGICQGTKKNINNYIDIPLIQLPENNSKQITHDKQQYYGQPDMIRTKTGKFIVAFPAGHGKGPLIMKTSFDGLNWVDYNCSPKSWHDSQEIPTLYTLDFNNNSQTLILISGKPSWPFTKYHADGFQYSISNNDGETWSEFTKVHSPFDSIVAMSSLTKLKESGEYVDKWQGTFHTHEFINYKSILTFDEKGNANWSYPQPLFQEAFREIEQKNQLCELEIFRANNTLILFARNNKRKPSMISFSTDEGNTWSQPEYLPYDLTGDRFRAAYDNLSSQLLLSFRQIIPVREHALGYHSFMSYGWVMWVGDVQKLLNYTPNSTISSNESIGGYLILLGSDQSGDCGYSGIIDNNGIITSVSYGLYNDSPKPHIRCVQFSLQSAISFPKILN